MADHASQKTEYTDRLTDLSHKGVMDFAFYNCGVEHCAPGYAYGPKRRDYHFIHFVLDGRGELVIGDRRYAVEAGQLFIVPAGEVSLYRADERDPWTYCWICFLGMQSDRYVETLLQCDPCRYVQNCAQAPFYERQIEEILSLDDRRFSTSLRANGIMFGILGNLTEELGAVDFMNMDSSIAQKARQYMESNYYDAIQIGEVAKAVGVHPNYLSKVFREQYHESPKQFLSELKVQKSKDLLAHTDLSISIIANSVGYADQMAYSKFFRRMTGESPTEYRMRKKRDHD